ncbi:MAG: hypothetical protein ACRDYZ_07755 [Acidimicrobiales bacterium]
MATDRTLVTELATALGTLPFDDLSRALAARSSVLRIDGATWDRLARLHGDAAYHGDFVAAYRNGKAFAAAADGLARRPPRLVEWTGGRRPPGDEVAPIDLRIDHVYLVSCKYLSANIANASPARLFDGLLATTGTWDRTDWYQAVAPDEYQDLYAACRACGPDTGQDTGLDDLPDAAAELTAANRERLRHALRDRRYPAGAQDPYRRLCAAVSARSAERWQDRLSDFDPVRMLWRLLRIGNAPYFLLGADGAASLRCRVDTPWDWHHAYKLRGLTVAPADAGQPRVDWAARYAVRATGEEGVVRGHVEVRWSHGRFGQPPEAKVYLDTPVDRLPGYHPFGDATELGQARFPGTWSTGRDLGQVPT